MITSRSLTAQRPHSRRTQTYYEAYWARRAPTARVWEPPPFLPIPLRRFTVYGSVRALVPPGARVLDIGCGDGHVAASYATTARVYGLDISHLALRHAAHHSIAGVAADLNNITLPFQSFSFDIVVMIDVIEHIISPIDLLRECLRVMRNSGELIIAVPNFARASNRLRMLVGDPVDMLHWDRYGDEQEHLHWFTMPKLQYLLRSVGFTAVYVPNGLPLDWIFGLLGHPGLGKMLVVRARPATNDDKSCGRNASPTHWQLQHLPLARAPASR